ncbi:serine carboxypeptidase-like 16 [Artemisia annua]|uniref:Serine carboxypeptidase-like 16 n=1 Tax=Artemisia annua TaxID=35608 RepID=A0A2U1NVA4_ARTAN|nr:serine carboxypeptidase-like 16 [Artemisia annua]
MGCLGKTCTLSSLLIFSITYQFYMIPFSNSQTIINSLPGYDGDLPFSFETGYVGVGGNEEVQLFYYFVESQRNPEEDPLLIYLPGGPGGSALVTLLSQIDLKEPFVSEAGLIDIVAVDNVVDRLLIMWIKLFNIPFYQVAHQVFDEMCPLSFKVDNDIENLTLTMNPYSWTKLANIIFIDIPAGVGYSYGETKEASVSSDNIMVTQATDFVKKFLIKHPKFLKNPLYIMGMSYMGIVTPAITLELYEGNERGDQPTLNIQGYILCSPLTDKFMDFNSRFIFAYRVALISEDIYKLGIESCDADYLNTDTTNSFCAYSLQRYKEKKLVRYIKLEKLGYSFINIANLSHFSFWCMVIYNRLRRVKFNPMFPHFYEYFYKFLNVWANTEAVQKALNVCQGTIEKWEPINMTIHYIQGKKDTACYSYDIFSSFAYHKKLVRKKCRALVFSGDHDLTFPYVGVEKWIASLDMKVEIPWKPFYVDAQVGGYEESYAQDDYSLTYTTVKVFITLNNIWMFVQGAGHGVPFNKPRESMDMAERWLAWQSHSSNS